MRSPVDWFCENGSTLSAATIEGHQSGMFSFSFWAENNRINNLTILRFFLFFVCEQNVCSCLWYGSWPSIVTAVILIITYTYKTLLQYSEIEVARQKISYCIFYKLSSMFDSDLPFLFMACHVNESKFITKYSKIWWEWQRKIWTSTCCCLLAVWWKCLIFVFSPFSDHLPMEIMLSSFCALERFASVDSILGLERSKPYL